MLILSVIIKRVCSPNNKQNSNSKHHNELGENQMNKKLMIAEEILRKLNNQIEVDRSKAISDRKFSRKWLNKSSSYLSAIKSENTDISGDALFNLFGTVIATRISLDENVLTNKDKSMESMCFKKAEFFLDLEYWLSDQIYTQAAEKQGIIF